MIRLTNEQRQEIIDLYLLDPLEATKLAVSKGLTPAYAYKLAYERGVLARTSIKYGKLRESA